MYSPPEKRADKMLGIRIDRKRDKYTPKKKGVCQRLGLRAEWQESMPD